MMMIHIQHRGEIITNLTTLMDHYFLLYLPFDPPSFCPLLYLSLLLPVFSLRPFALLHCLSSPCSVSSLLLEYFLYPSRRGYIWGKNVLRRRHSRKQGRSSRIRRGKAMERKKLVTVKDER